MEQETRLTQGSGVLIFLLLFLLTTGLLGAMFYKYFFQKNYNFIVEALCDTANENCFARDCTDPEDCPPNSFERYKTYEISAADYEKCIDGTCGNECKDGIISCTEVVCGDAEEDECSFPESSSLIVPIFDTNLDTTKTTLSIPVTEWMR
jgi:hypothetical protein